MKLPKHDRMTVAILTVFFAILIFHAMFNPDKILFSTDDNLGTIAQIKSHLPNAFIGYWSDSPLLGSGNGRVPLGWTSLWMRLLPSSIFKNWYHALNLVGASIFLALFLRDRGLSVPSQVMGLLTAFWLGSNLTLTYAGHMLKYPTLFLAMATFWCITRAVCQHGVAWSLFTGVALGLMFLEQQDVAIFICFFVAAFGLYEFIRVNGLRIPALILRFIPMLICALLISGPTLLAIYASNISATKDKSSSPAEVPQQKWEFATQWSWPPEECIDFIAPGYLGWRSGEPEGPYWGRMGRSAGWEQTHQGFMNFKLENHYIGAIPVFLALFALFVVLINRTARPGPPFESTGVQTLSKAEIIFWSCAALIALLLSFGKYFPLYYLFYHLPLISSIRNPNKFLHIFQIAMGILAAYGFDLAIRSRATDAAEIKKFSR